MDTHCKLCDHHANQIEGDCCCYERYKNFRLWLCLASIWMNIMTLMSFDANREKMWQFRPSKKRHRIRNWLNLGSLEKFSKFKKRFCAPLWKSLRLNRIFRSSHLGFCLSYCENLLMIISSFFFCFWAFWVRFVCIFYFSTKLTEHTEKLLSSQFSWGGRHAIIQKGINILFLNLEITRHFKRKQKQNLRHF